MNRFWGRNDEGISPRFTRDDDQILALNYENICDVDYLNRLFLPDDSSQSNSETDVIIDSGDPQIMNSQVGSTLFSSELSEDLILFGNAPDLSRTCFYKRFNREVSATGKGQDSIASLQSKQVVVFEHMGKLMIDRCYLPVNNPKSTLTQDEKLPPSQNNLTHMVSGTLSSALSTLLSKSRGSQSKIDRNPFIFKKSTMDGILSLLFQICEESTSNILQGSGINAAVHSLSLPWSIHPSMLNVLRDMLTSCIHSSLNFAAGREGLHPIYPCGALVDENIKLAFSCFYGLLLLGK